jgi:hypothetical protein
MAHQPQQHQDENVVKERLALPLLLPVAALIGTIVPIVLIGELLLVFGEQFISFGEEHVVYPVFIALAITLLILGGATLIARTWARDDQ